jgi:DNA-binding winged helix-turn-helix (wHTH) protein/TolB-like protein
MTTGSAGRLWTQGGQEGSLYDCAVAAAMRVAIFGVFEFDLRALELRKQGRLVRLGHQPALALALLVRRAGDVVTREELQLAIWGTDTFVDFETGLSACINQVRTALGDRAASPRFVETLPRRGYRFLADVRAIGPVLDAPSDRDDRTTVEAGSAPTRREAVHSERLAAPPASGTSGPAGRRLAAVGAALVLTIAATAAWFTGGRGNAPIPVVAVLPVEAGSGSDLDEPARLMTEAIIGRLATAAQSRARVLSRLHTAGLRAEGRGLDAIHALGATYFVDVTVRPAGALVRVHAKLAHESGWILWTIDHDLPPADLLAQAPRLADRIADEVAHEIVAPPGRADSRLLTPAGAEALATARDQRIRGEITRAVRTFEDAVRLLPHHPAAWTGLGDAALQAVRDGHLDRAAGMARADAAARTALRIDPDYAAARDLRRRLAALRQPG